jgi:hypothetical protein
MIRALNTFVTALKASSQLGRACRLRDSGHHKAALTLARDTLALLRNPRISRRNFAITSVLVSCTVLAEDLGSGLNLPGAQLSDLEDSVAALGGFPPDANIGANAASDWLRYLNARLACRARDGESAV